MTRLPQPGGDEGSWGGVLNDYLSVAHDAAGNIKDIGVVATKYTLPNGGMPTAHLADGAVTAAKIADASISPTKLNNTINSSLSSAQSAVQSVNSKTGQSITLTAADVSAIASSEKGASGGVATLTGATLTASQIPPSVITKSTNSGDSGKAIDAYTGAPLVVGSGGVQQIVFHGATAGTARPSTSAPIQWVGSVTPNNAVDGDIWVATN